MPNIDSSIDPEINPEIDPAIDPAIEWIDRTAQRNKWANQSELLQIASTGLDIWNCYEFAWRSPRNELQRTHLQLKVSADSAQTFESKSLKLALAEYCHQRFDDQAAVIQSLASELRLATTEISLPATVRHVDLPQSLPGSDLCCDLWPADLERFPNQARHGMNIGALQSMGIKGFNKDLPVGLSWVHSFNFKSLCPRTGWPDFAVVSILMPQTIALRDSSKRQLKEYLASYSERGDFHEDCCEQIACWLHSELRVDIGIVSMNFTRRGGIDINPRRYWGDIAYLEDRDNYRWHHWQ